MWTKYTAHTITRLTKYKYDTAIQLYSYTAHTICINNTQWDWNDYLFTFTFMHTSFETCNAIMQFNIIALVPEAVLARTCHRPLVHPVATPPPGPASTLLALAFAFASAPKYATI